MPTKQFTIWINDQTLIAIRRHTESGRYTSFAVALLALLDQRWTCVGRFDTAHGVPHQDVLGKSAGLMRKVWFDNITPKEVFQLAITTFQNDHERILTNFLEN